LWSQNGRAGRTARSDTDGDGVVEPEDGAPRDLDVREAGDVRGATSTSAPGFGLGVAVVAPLAPRAVAHHRY
jgi:hypothetical protein